MYHRLTKLNLLMGSSDSQPEPVMGTLGAEQPNKTCSNRAAALIKTGVLFEIVLSRAHLSGWANIRMTWPSVQKGTFTVQSG